MELNYYDVLGVPVDAPQGDIRRAYRKLAMKHHPDRNQGSKISEEMFKLIQQAYDILSDPVKRRAYDEEQAEPAEDCPSHTSNASDAFFDQQASSHESRDGRDQTRNPHNSYTAYGTDEEAAAQSQTAGRRYNPYQGGQRPASSSNKRRWRVPLVLKLIFLLSMAYGAYIVYEVVQSHPASFNAAHAEYIPLAVLQPSTAQQVVITLISIAQPQITDLMNRIYGQNHIRSGNAECWLHSISATDQYCMKPLGASIAIVDGRRLLYLQVSGRQMMPGGLSIRRSASSNAIYMVAFGAAIWDWDSGKLLASQPFISLPYGTQQLTRPLELVQVACNGALGWLGAIPVSQEGHIYQTSVLFVQKRASIVNAMTNMPASFPNASRAGGGEQNVQYRLLPSNSRCIYTLEINQPNSADTSGRRFSVFNTWTWGYSYQ